MRATLSLSNLQFGGSAVGGPGGVGDNVGMEGTLYTTARFDVVFIREGLNSGGADLGSDIGGLLLLKRSTGNNRFDESPLQSVTDWTRYFSRSEVIGNVTADAGTNRLTLANHGLQDDELVYFTTGGTIPGGLTAGSLVYVVAAGPNTFGVSLTKGGAAIDITTAGTAPNSVTRVTDFYYRGHIALSEPVFEKLLGVDYKSQAEVVTLECVADVDDSLSSKYFDLYHGTGATDFHRVWMNMGGSAPSAGGGSLIPVSIPTNSTAEEVATEIQTVINAVGMVTHWQATRVDEVLTITAQQAEPRGWHSPADSGFTLTVIAAGMSVSSVTDVESVEVVGEFRFDDEEGEQQAAELFTLTIKNALYRPGLSAPTPTGGTNVRQGSHALSSGTSTVTVVFASPFPDADWMLTTAQVVNTTDATPLTLFAGTIRDMDAAGFTLELNGNTDSANYVFKYKAER